MSSYDRLELLKQHRENIATAANFEKFLKYQLAYVDHLIADMEAEKAAAKVMTATAEVAKSIRSFLEDSIKETDHDQRRPE